MSSERTDARLLAEQLVPFHTGIMWTKKRTHGILLYNSSKVIHGAVVDIACELLHAGNIFWNQTSRHQDSANHEHILSLPVQGLRTPRRRMLHKLD